MWKCVYRFLLCFNRYDYKDPELKAFVDRINSNYKAIAHLYGLMMFLPQSLACALGSKEVTTLKTGHQGQVDMVKKYIEEHKATFDPENVRDVIDAYIKGYTVDGKIPEKLPQTIQLFLFDSVTTSAELLRSIFLYIAMHPDLQKQIHKQIDEAVGGGKQVR